MTSLHSQTCIKLDWSVPIWVREQDFPDSRSSCLFANIPLYSSFSSRPISCSCQTGGDRDTDAFYQLLAGNFSTPQKTKAFCELFLSHSDPKRTEVLKYFFNIIGSQGFEHQNLKGRNPLNTSAFDAEVGKDLPETLFRVFLLLIHVCLQQPIAGQKTWARCQDYLNCLAEGARRSWFLLGSIYF